MFMFALVATILLIPAGLKIGGVKPCSDWTWAWVLSPVWIAAIIGIISVVLAIPIVRWIKNSLFPKPVMATAGVAASAIPAIPISTGHTRRNLLVVAALVAAIFAASNSKCHDMFKRGIEVISTIIS